MTLYTENETEMQFDFDTEETAKKVIAQILKTENCPYEATVNLLLTDNEGIRQFNRDYRDMDRPTDVLSFPNLDYEKPADFGRAEKEVSLSFDPDSGELILGDIIISADKVKEQAECYGHSEKREFAFLTAHSMLHLLGYDHMTEEEAALMEEKQEQALRELGILRA